MGKEKVLKEIRIEFCGSCGYEYGVVTDYGGWSFVVYFPDENIKYVESGVVRAIDYGQDKMGVLGAAYHAFAMSLKFLLKNDIRDRKISFTTNDEILVRQVIGAYRIKRGMYLPFAERAYKILDETEVLENTMNIEWRNHSEIKHTAQIAKEAKRQNICCSFSTDMRTGSSRDDRKFIPGKASTTPFYIANSM